MRTLEAIDPAHCPECRSDLAAAHIELGRGDVHSFVDALAAADEALAVNPRLAAARFNRALALESLGLDALAAAEYRRASAFADDDGAWREEARRRLVRLSRAPRRMLWPLRKRELERHAAAGNGEAVAAIVRTYPEESRTHGEGPQLADWADSVLAGDREKATERLAVARGIAVALRDTTGETLLLDVVRAIESSPDTRKLAAAHAAYRDARIAYARRSIAAPRAAFRELAEQFRLLRSPMSLLAHYYECNAMHDDHTTGEARAQLLALRASLPRGYRALRSSCDRLDGTLLGSSGRPYEARAAYAAAAAAFAAAGELRNAQEARAGMAWCAAQLGRPADAWAHYAASFAALSADGDPASLQRTLAAAADTELRLGRWGTARSTLALMLELAPAANNARLAAWAALWHALAASQLSAGGDLARARALAAAIPDPALRADALDDLRVAEAFIETASRPAHAIQLATEALRSARPLRMPDLYAMRGRARRAVGDRAGAADDFLQAVARIESTRTDELRDSFFGLSEELYGDLVDVLDDVDEAFAIAERRRAQAMQPMTLAQVRERLPDDVLLIHLTVRANETIAFAVSRDSANRTRVPLGRNALQQAIARNDTTLLYDRLLRPFRRAAWAVVVGDPDVMQIPFAALRDGESGQYAVEQMAVTVAPSATAFVRPAPRRGEPRLAAIGDPRFDSDRFRDLQPLTGAIEEVRRVARFYPRRTFLANHAATRRATETAMSDADVIHIAAHAVNGDSRSGGALLLTPDGADAGILYLRDITSLRLDADLAFLAGCGTAVSTSGYGDLRNLAAAFNAAGARNVVASLWDLDDAIAPEIAVRFHERYAGGSQPHIALRQAQLSMLQSPDRRLQSPRAWAALQLITTYSGREEKSWIPSRSSSSD